MDASVPMAVRVDAADGGAADWAATLIQQRQTILPRRLQAPGPDAAQLEQIVAAAVAAPDHGQLVPWRFVLVPESARGALAEAFEQALVQRDPLASADQRAQSREKAFRSPTLLLAVARLADEAEEAEEAEEMDSVPVAERLLSAGCAIQNMLLMATALGFGSALTSGKALQSPPLRDLFRLRPTEQALCFISIGTPAGRKAPRLRPLPAQVLTILEPPT